jgi:DNA repair photolyase
MKTKKNSFKGKSLYRPTGKAGEYSAWACNFYTGCSNNCSYCYCKRGVMSHVWSDEPMLKKCFKDKDHAVAVFEKEMLANIDELRKTGIFFSFTTDPMIPGKTLELTMEAVGLALRNDVPVQILAKRADWLDAEAWKVMCATINPDYKKIAVGFTLTRRDDLEPGASPHTERIVAMKRCHELGCHTFASVEPIVDIANSEWAMSDAYPYCELFKVGLMSGGAKPDKYELKELVDRWNNTLDKSGKKIYWKQSVVDYLGDDFTFWMDSCVDADYNIFSY